MNIGDIFESNSSGKFKIIKKQSQKSVVQFIDTGWTTTAHNANIVAGKVKDHSLKYIQPLIFLNERYESNMTGWFTVIFRVGKKCMVQFDSTGTTLYADYYNARNGKVKDPYGITVNGVGWLGEFEKVSYWKKAIQLWRNMMKRCYNPKDKKGYFGKCFVDQRWKCFANFLNDLPELENFDKWLENGEVKYNLDKDSLVNGNNIYSKLTCRFITEFENKRLGSLHSLEINGPIHLRNRVGEV